MDIIKTDIAVIGGGASGIAAAIEAKRTSPKLKVVIAERLDRVGRKILVTGSGRCNLTNRSITPEDYHGTVSNVTDIIGRTQNTEEFFRNLGVLCCADSEGRVYPYSFSAASVLTALRLKLKADGTEEICGFCAVSIEKSKNGYTVTAEDGRKILCRKIIAACGGYASPANGTDGKAMKMFRDMGVKTEKICPAVAPLRVNPDDIKGLKGVRVHGRVTAVSGGRELYSEQGEIQFTENAVSGICVFNLAWFFRDYEGKLSVKADLMPEYSEKQVKEIISETVRSRAGLPLEELLNGIFVKNLAVYIMKKSLGRPLTDSISDLGDRETGILASYIKNMEFRITGCSSWQNAQVTCGGISGTAVNRQLQLVSDQGIYFAGEILDTDGKCGGYNLEWAWSSGMWAGRNCAQSFT